MISKSLERGYLSVSLGRFFRALLSPWVSRDSIRGRGDRLHPLRLATWSRSRWGRTRPSFFQKLIKSLLCHVAPERTDPTCGETDWKRKRLPSPGAGVAIVALVDYIAVTKYEFRI